MADLSWFDATLHREVQEYPDPFLAFADEIRGAGLVVDQITETGDRPERVDTRNSKRGKKPGWYFFRTFTTASGVTVGCGTWGDWSTGEGGTWSSVAGITDADRVALREHQARQATAAEAARVDARAQAAIEARELCARLPAATTHPYLTAKGVQGHGALIDVELGALVLPMRDAAGQITSVQRIYPDGTKRYLAGGQKGTYQIGAGWTNPTYIVEGFATGATVHEITGRTVVVAFDAGGLAGAVRAVRAQYSGPIVIAADNDRHTAGNPGITRAEAAAAGVPGVRVIAPEFRQDQGTDYNDLATIEGVEAARAQLGGGKLDQPFFSRVEQLAARPAQWVVEGVIPQDAIGAIFGPSGSHKTFVALDLIGAVGTATPWHGRRIRQPGAVAYICGEGAAGIGNRMAAWSIKRGVPLDGAPIYVSRTAAPLLDGVAMDGLLADLGGIRERLSLVVVDTLARNFGDGDENSASDMGRFVGACDRIRQATGATVMLVHHTGHGNKERARGSSALYAALDFELGVAMDPGGLVVVQGTKSKDAEQAEKIVLRPLRVPLGTDDEGAEWGSLALEAVADATEGAAIAAGLLASAGGAPGRRLTARQQSVVAAVGRLIEQAEARLRAAGAWTEGRVVTVLRAEVIDSLPVDLRRDHANRAIDDLIAAGRLSNPDGQGVRLGIPG